MSDRGKQPLISPREWRFFWIVALVLATVTGGITALSTWLSRPEEPKNVLPSQSPFRADTADTIPPRILLSDLDVSAPGGTWLSRSWLFSRTAGGRPWTDDEIAPYWTEPSELPLATLPAQNDAALDRLLESVP